MVRAGARGTRWRSGHRCRHSLLSSPYHFYSHSPTDAGAWTRPAFISSAALLGCWIASFHLSRHSCWASAIELTPRTFPPVLIIHLVKRLFAPEHEPGDLLPAWPEHRFLAKSGNRVRLQGHPDQHSCHPLSLHSRRRSIRKLPDNAPSAADITLGVVLGDGSGVPVRGRAMTAAAGGFQTQDIALFKSQS